MALSLFDPSNQSWDNHRIRLLHFQLDGTPVTTGVDDTTTLAGLATQIEVSVSNISAQAVGFVRVEAWVCDPMPTTTPQQLIPGTGPFTGSRAAGLTAHDTKPIVCMPAWTTPNVVHVGPPANKVPAWSPAETQGGPAGSPAAHHCVMANTWLDDGTEGKQLGDGDAFDIVNNPHHAQRNINVVVVPHDPVNGAVVHFHFTANNPDARQDPEVLLSIQQRRGRVALAGLQRDLMHTGPFAGVSLTASRVNPASFGLENRIPSGVAVTPIDNGKADLADDQRSAKLHLRERQRAHLSIAAHFNPSEKPHTFHTFDVMQTTAAGRLQGGLRLITVLVPK